MVLITVPLVTITVVHCTRTHPVALDVGDKLCLPTQRFTATTVGQIGCGTALVSLCSASTASESSLLFWFASPHLQPARRGTARQHRPAKPGEAAALVGMAKQADDDPHPAAPELDQKCYITHIQ